MKWKKPLRWIVLILIVAVLVVTFVVTSSTRKHARCCEVKIFFDGDDQYISSSEIERLVYARVPRLKGCLLDTLNTERLERQLERNSWVKNAEVFKGVGPTEKTFFGGILNVHITQYEPVFRVQEGDGGFFVAEGGNTMPYRLGCPKKLLVVTGDVEPGNINEDLFTLVDYITGDRFWRAQIEQVHVRHDGEFVLVPRVGNHLIELGSIDEMEKKFRNLKAMYADGFKQGGWNKYRSVSLKYTNQVICTLR